MEEDDCREASGDTLPVARRLNDMIDAHPLAALMRKWERGTPSERERFTQWANQYREWDRDPAPNENSRATATANCEPLFAQHAQAIETTNDTTVATIRLNLQ